MNSPVNARGHERPSPARRAAPRHRAARRVSALVLLCAAIASTSCASKLGSRALPDTRLDYNAAIAESSETQMLLNVVRLRYQHSPQFLELNSVVTQYTLTQTAGASGAANFANPNMIAPGASAGANVGVTVTERPTVTYTPLQGEKFVKRLLKPITPEVVLMLLEAGWSADLLFRVCVRRINELHAPPYAERGATPSSFERFTALLQALQDAHALNVEFVNVGERVEAVLVPRRQADGRPHPAAIEALRMIGVDPGLPAYRLVAGGIRRAPNEIVMHGRSLLSALFYLSQGVSVPAGDPAARELGRAPLTSPLLRVKTSSKPPTRAYAKARYRGQWYYIAEDDPRSRGPFVLLNALFSLMSTAPQGSAPVLTVPAG